MKIKLISKILVILLLSSCSERIIDFTVISSKNVDLSRSADFKRSPNRVTGKDVRHIYLIIPTGNPSAKQALDRAIESTPGAVALADGVLNHRWWYIPYIYGQFIYEVEGTPLIDQNLAKEFSAK